MADRHRRNPVRLRADQHDRLAEIAERTGKPLADLLAEAIDQYLDELARGAVHRG